MRPSMKLWSLLFVVALAGQAVPSSAVHAAATVLPVQGGKFNGDLTGLAPDGQATFTSDGGSRTLPLADIVRWGNFSAPRRGIEILLAGGGLLVADTIEADAETLQFESELLGKQTLPLERLAGIILQPPPDSQARDRLALRIRAGTARTDRLLLENGDELAGTIGPIDRTTVKCASGGQDLSIKRARVAAVAYDPSLATAAKPAEGALLVGLSDGSRLWTSSLTVDKQQATLHLPDHAVWSLPTTAITCLQPRSPRVVYLSDLKSDSFRHLPFLGVSWPYRNDANALGTQLRGDGTVHTKGIGMHSAARLTFRLDPRFKYFAADVALDEVVGQGGSVIFAVYTDDKLAWKSDVIRSGEAPTPVHVELDGAKRLSLLVEYAERGDVLDRANWLDARLVE